MIEMLEVQNPKDFPSVPVYGFRAKSVEEIRQWAERRKAETVWYYRHKFGHAVYTAVMAMAIQEQAKQIEKASADLVRVAEGAA